MSSEHKLTRKIDVCTRILVEGVQRKWCRCAKLHFASFKALQQLNRTNLKFKMSPIVLESKSVIDAASVIPENTPIVMLNLNQYKKHADYGARAAEFEPLSGQDAYNMRYVAWFHKYSAEHNITVKIVFLGQTHFSLVGKSDEQWDNVVLVEYPNYATFRSIVESEDYKTNAAFHREACLDNWRLIANTQIGV